MAKNFSKLFQMLMESRQPKIVKCTPATPAAKAKPKSYLLHISIRHTNPLIWRRVQVRNDITFYGLHCIIQKAFEWKQEHLFSFKVKKTRIGMSDDEYAEADCKESKLCDFGFRARSQFSYEYDFGDSWHHDIVVEKALPPQDKKCILIDGAQAGPPEDSGGAWGYNSKLDALADKKHRDHCFVMEWLGENFDPEKFDLEKVQKRFR